jgi:hypothetical protein
MTAVQQFFTSLFQDRSEGRPSFHIVVLSRAAAACVIFHLLLLPAATA